MKKKLLVLLMLCMFMLMLAPLIHAESTACEHVYGEWNTKQDATCTADGMKVRMCSKCGAVDTDTIAATGHAYGEWNTKQDVTCTTDGVKVRICDKCGDVDTDTIPATGHAYGEWNTKQDATCTADGVKVRICGKCGAVDTDTIPATGHAYGEWNTKQDATCTADGVKVRICGKCGAIDTEKIDKRSHQIETIPGMEATCIADGLTEGEKCSACGEVLKEQTVIIAKGHQSEILPGKAATCTEDGLTEGEKCFICGAVLKAQESIPAVGHQYKSSRIAPTTTSFGYTRHTCKVCGDTYKDQWRDKLPSETPQLTPAPVDKIQKYGSIVTDEQGNALPYEYQADAANADMLKIVAGADVDGNYKLALLHITPELLAQLKNENVARICFVVDNAALTFSLDMFDNEDIALITKDMAQLLSGYAIAVDPTTKNDENKAGCRVQVLLAMQDGGKVDITAFADGMQLMLDGKTIEVTESAIYVF